MEYALRKKSRVIHPAYAILIILYNALYPMINAVLRLHLHIHRR